MNIAAAGCRPLAPSYSSALPHPVLAAWRDQFGDDRVDSPGQASARYGLDTDAVPRRILGAVRAQSTEEVQTVVRIAQRHHVALYPISTGKNWGYGTALPTHHDVALLDLSLMKNLDVDEELGTATVQPGVTQADLRALLDERRLPWMVPTTGAGPRCSLMGNALERGYGITPHTDHFAAVLSLEAVLADGSLYRSPLAQMGAEDVCRAFKWGIGPYLDGLFAQGGFGIVTRMTIALARQPERIESFYFWIDDPERLDAAVEVVRDAIAAFPGVLGGVNVMNARRVLSMIASYPIDEVPRGAAISSTRVAEMASSRQVGIWMGMGSLYGEKAVVRAVRRSIRRRLRSVAARVVFVSQQKAHLLSVLAQWLPKVWRQKVSGTLYGIRASLELMSGRPNEVALALPYWKRGAGPSTAPRDPAHDRCGLLWYAPLVPMRPRAVRAHVRMVEETCLSFGIEPLITLTSLSERCFDTTVPILFDVDDPQDIERAHACLQTLFERGAKLGFLPYRIGSVHRDLMISAQQPYWRLVTELKEALDPEHRIAPGRYALAPGELEEWFACDIQRITP